MTAPASAEPRRFDFARISVDRVTRAFGRRRVLSNVSFACGAGEIVGVLGPNGAGKSTLFAIIATLLSPTSGEVRYGDATAAGPTASDVRARLGLLGHDLYLYPELTARENLTFFASLYGLGDVDALVEERLAAAGLAGRADDEVHRLSRGMRQRLALERALVHRPRLVLLDEPFTGLDDSASADLVARLDGLRATGAIVLVSTHDFEIVGGLLDRAIVLDEGRVAGVEEDPTDLRHRYRARLGRRPETRA